MGSVTEMLLRMLSVQSGWAQFMSSLMNFYSLK